jgi:hypothetical protein
MRASNHWFTIPPGEPNNKVGLRPRSSGRPTFQLAALLLPGLPLYLPGRVALGLLLGYLLLSIDAYLATYALGTFHLSFWKFSPTEMRILLAVGNAVAFFRPYALGGRFLFFDVAGAIAIFSMAVVLVVSVARNTRALYLAERV